MNAGVAFHFKQWGNWYPQETCGIGDDGAATSFIRMSKKNAGRILDGRTWNELPYGYSDRVVRRSPAGDAPTACAQTAS